MRLRDGSDLQNITANLYLAESGHDFGLSGCKHCHELYQLSHIAQILPS